jgi:hypothetical protein
MDTKLHVTFLLSEASRQRQFVATGQLPEREQKLELDMAAATPEQRQAVITVCGADLRLEIGKWDRYIILDDPTLHLEPVELDAIPDLEAVIAHGQRMQAEKQAAQVEYDADRRQVCEADLAKKIQALRDCLARRVIGGIYDTELWRYDLAEHGKRLQIDRSGYDAVRADYDAMAAIRKAEIETEHQADEARKRSAAEQVAAARQAWIDEHGSEHLRRAVAAGYDCTRKYLIERAELEYPGYMCDFENAAKWRSRSCPNLEALDEQSALLAAHPGISVDIVWLTSPARDQKLAMRDDCEEEENEFEPREAIVVTDPAYDGKDLVK